MAGGKAAAEARAVTAVAVRCSAWLGVSALFDLGEVIKDILGMNHLVELWRDF